MGDFDHPLLSTDENGNHKPRPRESLEKMRKVLRENPYIDPATLLGIYGYTTADYSPLNGMLRDNDVEAIGQHRNYIKRIDEGLQALPDHDGVTYRGKAFSEEDFARLQAAHAHADQGATFSDNGYTSTSIDANVGMRFAMEKGYSGKGADRKVANGKVPCFITVKGLHGKEITAVSSVAGEAEVTFGRSTKFKVESIQLGKSPDGLPMYHVVMSEIEMPATTMRSKP
jgi:ADP-ribosyltransferase exoenzyme